MKDSSRAYTLTAITQLRCAGAGIADLDRVVLVVEPELFRQPER